LSAAIQPCACLATSYMYHWLLWPNLVPAQSRIWCGSTKVQSWIQGWPNINIAICMAWYWKHVERKQTKNL